MLISVLIWQKVHFFLQICDNLKSSTKFSAILEFFLGPTFPCFRTFLCPRIYRAPNLPVSFKPCNTLWQKLVHPRTTPRHKQSNIVHDVQCKNTACEEIKIKRIHSRHVTIQLRHGSLNWKITQPEGTSRMRCDTVANRNRKSRWPEFYHNFVTFFYTSSQSLSSPFSKVLRQSCDHSNNETYRSPVIAWPERGSSQRFLCLVNNYG